jgi:putative endonuclease
VFDRQYFIYIITNKINTVLYVGVTSNLIKRIYEHKNKLISGFSSRYNLSKLVYLETFDNIHDALNREKQIKAGSRQKKLELIKRNNPNFNDLYSQIF